ncbi:MAG: 13E12 repeat family protein [Actinomycetota bacterium]|nr:13E12 repeat family protein [Actinomycetota bacterium]
MSTAPTPVSTAEALAMLKSATRYLAAADPTEMATAEQAECLQSLEEADALRTAARASIISGFAANQGYCADGAYSPRSWLIHQTRITRGAAAGHLAWARRGRTHPRVLQALATAQMSESYARAICGWTDQIPEDRRNDADEILASAAGAGMDLRDLAALAAEIQTRSRPDTPDDDNPGRTLADRAVRLETTFQGAGVLSGDLTPECAALMNTVLEALSAPRGAEDDRSHVQRFHDALEEAMKRLVAAGLVPARAGQPAKVIAHISLTDLLDLDTRSTLREAWTERVRARWAAARAAASVSGSDGTAWLEGEEARGFACDASITPIVFGEVNLAVLDGLVGLCVQLAGHGPGHCHPAFGGSPVPPTLRGRHALEREIIGKAVALLSGPGGLASFLRRRELGARLSGPSLPLDVGVSKDVPAGIRQAIRERDQHCRFPAGCDEPASRCEIHHLTHQARGGKTSVNDCALFCWYHHHIVIHEMGWTVVLNRDGTTTAYSPDKTKILHSHDPPPARAG